MLDEAGREALIIVDGGITKENITEVAGMSADIIVTGSAVFKGGEPEPTARRMLAKLLGPDPPA